jgi:hypothetical protein
MINCDNKDLPTEAIFGSIIQTTDDGNSMRMVEVDTTGSVKYYDCDTIDVGLSLEDVFRPLIGLNGNNEPALRIGLNTDCTPDTDAVNCNTKDETMLSLLRSMVHVTPGGEQFLLVCLDTL